MVLSINATLEQAQVFKTKPTCSSPARSIRKSLSCEEFSNSLVNATSYTGASSLGSVSSCSSTSTASSLSSSSTKSGLGQLLSLSSTPSRRSSTPYSARTRRRRLSHKYTNLKVDLFDHSSNPKEVDLRNCLNCLSLFPVDAHKPFDEAEFCSGECCLSYSAQQEC